MGGSHGDSAARLRLQARLGVLTGRTERLEGHFRGEDGRLDADTQDVVSFSANDEVVDGLESAVSLEIQEIRAALQRMDDGSYGLCASCGDEVPAPRLAAVPSTRFCVDCADDA